MQHHYCENNGPNMFFMADHLDAIYIKISTRYTCLPLFLAAKIYCDIDHVGNTDCDIVSSDL